MNETALKHAEQKFKVLAGIILTIFLLLMVRLWVLQIMEGATIMVKSIQNQTRVIRINAPRGIFYDRNGKIMVTSRISRNVLVVPDDLKDKPEIIQKLSEILNISVAELQEKLKPNPKLAPSRYQYIPISKDIDPTTALKLLEAKLDLPGVEVDEVPLRFYPNGEFASHLFGYIREISDQELHEHKEQGYRLGDLIGKNGLERTFETELRGVEGGKIFEVDIRGRNLRQMEDREPLPGNNLHLTIDYKVQAAAEKALDEQFINLQKNSKFRNAKSGLALALDPRNGQILAMVSKPGYDPNLFVGVIPPDVAKNLYNNPLHPFSNRVTQGEFAPGSTFKPVTVLSALMENKVNLDNRFYCNGYDPVWGKRFKCWTVGSTVGPHGTQSVIDGLKNSCNIVMAELARRLGAGDAGARILAKYSRFLGFGKKTGLDVFPGERSGFVPDPEWKRKNTRDKDWYPLETLHFSIGQGYLTVTPLQLAQLYAAIANDGKIYQPQVVSKITTFNGEVVREFKPKLVKDLNIPLKMNQIVREGLTEVINEGTASYIFRGFPLDKYPVAGKTGTVQRPPYDNSGVFACYAPADKPEIVIIILIEQGGSGSGGAAPVARKILEAYFNVEQKTKEPVVKPESKPSAQPQVSPATGTESKPESAVNQVESGTALTPSAPTNPPVGGE